MVSLADPSDVEVFGDLVVHLTQQGRTAEIGYTLARDAWGKGYAVEATTALVEYLFETMDVTRIEAMLHPDNPASAMVLERVGLLFEGHTRSSFWLGDENSDDWIYGMIRSDWESWRERPRHRPDRVDLVEVTRENLHDVLVLATHRSQQRFVEPIAHSLADALIPPASHGETVVPWYRAIRADGDLVGFVMVARSTLRRSSATSVAPARRPITPATRHRWRRDRPGVRPVPGLGRRGTPRVVVPRQGVTRADVPRRGIRADRWRRRQDRSPPRSRMRRWVGLRLTCVGFRT